MNIATLKSLSYRKLLFAKSSQQIKTWLRQGSYSNYLEHARISLSMSISNPFPVAVLIRTIAILSTISKISVKFVHAKFINNIRGKGELNRSQTDFM